MTSPSSNDRSSSPIWDTFVEGAKGSAIGSGVIAAVSPWLYAKNMKQINAPRIAADSTRGASLSAGSFVATTTIQMGINKGGRTLYAGDRNLTTMEEFAITGVCGGVAGLLGSTAPESVVQNHQKTGISVAQVARNIYAQGGLPRLMAGGSVVFSREGFFAQGYGVAAKTVGSVISPYVGDSRVVADTIGAAVSGAVVGAVTNPLDLMRARKQGAAMSAGTIPSYRQIVCQEGVQGLSRGTLARSKVVAAATTLMTLGRHGVDSLFSDRP